MKEGRTSKTAEIAAAIRALHHRYASPAIFEDPFALEFTNPTWRRIVVTKPLRWLVFEVLLRSMRPVAAQVVARSRYAEDLLDAAIASGIGQYVIVGAGFDSFALRRRDLESTVRVFELDHPDTQRAKRERLSSIGVDLPGNVEFVGVDFERETVADGLMQSSYQPNSPAFFSWLGTTPYLSNSATLGTLASIAQLAAPRTEVVFDYLVADETLSSSERRIVEKLKRFTARRGEPLVGEFHPAELEKVLRSVGLDLIANFSGADQEKRYFAGRQDGLRPMAASFFAHARVPVG
ncbi:MAG: SAM-dependent methyltransferase [Myxococcales bacterium]|jgi:methyltransferase (TIGR00027 family)|nr:MAG: SAM-dependent methyltransferase [Myxococcales bacterium]